MKTLETELHTFSFPSEHHPEYIKLRAALERDGRHMMRVYDMDRETKPKAGIVKLEIEHLFSDQWNTACGFRVFDWYEGIIQGSTTRRGHWLEITPAMRALRRDTHSCGYCNVLYGPEHAQEHGSIVTAGRDFCGMCLDSKYLKPEDLQLLALHPVEEHFPQRAALSEGARKILMSHYVRQQTSGSDSRNARKLRKQRTDNTDKLARTIELARVEHDGFLWLLDHDFPIDNVIFYTHTGRFGFGWRSSLAPELVERLLAIISELSFPYDIKTSDGRTLSGN